MDDELLSRARRGDPVALEALLERAAPTILRFARRMCRNDADADDVLQDTMLAASSHLRDFEGRSSLSSWLYALARSACTRKRRGLANRPATDADDLAERADLAPSPEGVAAARELAALLERALAAIPEQHREVLVLRDVEGLSAAEAAEVLGIGVDALKSRLHRARAALRDAIAPLLEPAPAPSAGCPDVILMLSRKLEGELTGTDCAAMEAHVAGCAACSARCDVLKSALEICRAARDAPVPPDVRARVARALDAVRASARR
jgi:RNA polymerase sigma-70 factor (ECF subfamily)